MTRVCVVGSVNVDHFFTVDTLPGAGETVLASSMTTAPGGKGANQAVAAARAGAAVTFVGAIGNDDAGTRLRDHLRSNGVDVTGLSTLDTVSGSAVVMVDTHAENLIVVAPGANGRLVLEAAAQTLIAASDVLLTQLEIPIATAVAAARAARAAGVDVIVNASPIATDPQLADLATLADVVVVNDTEEQHWVWPVPHLVVTRGSRGASYLGVDGQFDVPAPLVEPVDTTGAGDVFAGVLASQWRHNHQEAIRSACAAGALATLAPGAGNCAPERTAIESVLRDVPIDFG